MRLGVLLAAVVTPALSCRCVMIALTSVTATMAMPETRNHSTTPNVSETGPGNQKTQRHCKAHQAPHKRERAPLCLGRNRLLQICHVRNAVEISTRPHQRTQRRKHPEERQIRGKQPAQQRDRPKSNQCDMDHAKLVLISPRALTIAAHSIIPPA